MGARRRRSQPRATRRFPTPTAMTYFARGARRVAHRATRRRARVAIDSLHAIQRRLRASGEPYWAEQVAIQQLGVQAWLALAEQRESDALATMREAAAREDATEKSAVTPGPLAPARELLGDMLMELRRERMRARSIARHSSGSRIDDMRCFGLAAPDSRW